MKKLVISFMIYLKEKGNLKLEIKPLFFFLCSPENVQKPNEVCFSDILTFLLQDEFFLQDGSFLIYPGNLIKVTLYKRGNAPF